MVVSLVLFSTALYALRTRADFKWSGPALRLPALSARLQNEKRRHVRRPCNVFLELFNETDRASGDGRLLNLSEEGALFSSKSNLRFGDRILARPAQPTSGLSRLTGRVVWSRPRLFVTLYGIRFVPSNPAN